MGSIKNILVTGATGYLGSNLVEALLNRGYNIVVLKRRLSDVRRIKHLLNRIRVYDLEGLDLKEIFENNPIDCVIHTAASYGRKQETLMEVYDANLILPIKLLEQCIVHHVKVFLNASTALPAELNVYALSKKQFSETLKMRGELLKVIDIELQYFYGAGDDSSKFITFIISEMLNGRQTIDLSSGIQVRDFIYIKDVVSAYLVLISRVDDMPNYQKVPLGLGSGIALKELTIMIKELIGTSYTLLNFDALPLRTGEVMYSVADTNILNDLGWGPEYSLKEGLTETINLEKSSFYDYNKQ